MLILFISGMNVVEYDYTNKNTLKYIVTIAITFYIKFNKYYSFSFGLEV